MNLQFNIMMDGVNHGLSMGLYWIIGLLVLAVIIWLIVKVVSLNNNSNLLKNKSPLNTLKKRYARGKISKNEYYKKRKIIL